MKGLFKAIGNFFKAVGRAFASAAKAIVRSGIGRAILQIIACANPAAAITCPAAAAGLTLAAGGSLKEALFAAAISFGQMGAYSIVGGIVQSVGVGTVAAGVVKLGLHAVVGGAFSVAQGGSFMTGAVTGAIAAGTSLMMEGTALGNMPGDGGMIARTAIAAVAGGTASVLSGGKFANGAITGAMAHLFNYEPSKKSAELLARRGALAAGAAAADGPAPVGDLVGLGVLAYTALELFTWAPADTGSDSGNHQYVVRAGIAADNAEAGTAWTDNGYGFSVQTRPGLTHDELARPMSWPNGKYSYTTVKQLESIPGVKVTWPTPGAGPNHGTVNVPPSGAAFGAISNTWTKVTNPYRPTN